MEQQKLHVAIIASPGMGHLIPVLLLGNRLATHHNIHVTILAVTLRASPVESQLLCSLTDPTRINIVTVPLPDISKLIRPDDAVVTQIAVMMREARPTIRSAISAMNPRAHVLIGDLFASESLPIADEFRMQKYIYVPCLARFLALTVYLHVLDKEVKGQYVDRVEPLRIPGCEPVRCKDVPDPMLDRNNRQYDEYVRMGVDFVTLSNGILLNTWRDMDRKSLDALKYDEKLRSIVKVPVYEIGPLTREIAQPGSEGSKVIDWLDMQPIASVVFISFGSGGTLSFEQITELAWGLEYSQQRFVWVIRPPVASATDGAYFDAKIGSDELVSPNFLPKGFLTRTQNLGLVVPLWGPQVMILNHKSIGGFMSHCGLNSIYESIKGAVPMIAWPLYAEQRMNSTILTDELKVAIRPSVMPAEKVVGRKEIEIMVRRLMEGKEGNEMKERMKVLRKSANDALEINGSSYNSMCDFISCCEMNMKCKE